MAAALQDLYADEFSHCYGCGRNNANGFKLRSYWRGDEADEANETIAHFTAAAQFSGGVPGHVYGGLIASLLDCHGTASATAFRHRERGDRDSGGPAQRCVTASLKVDYLRPTPIGVELTIIGRLRAIEGRKVWVDLELSAGGETCARGEMLAIALSALRSLQAGDEAATAP